MRMIIWPFKVAAISSASHPAEGGLEWSLSRICFYYFCTPFSLNYEWKACDRNAEWARHGPWRRQRRAWVNTRLVLTCLVCNWYWTSQTPIASRPHLRRANTHSRQIDTSTWNAAEMDSFSLLLSFRLLIVPFCFFFDVSIRSFEMTLAELEHLQFIALDIKVVVEFKLQTIPNWNSIQLEVFVWLIYDVIDWFHLNCFHRL